MDAKHFGYWSLRWAAEAVGSGIKLFESEPFCTIPACRTASENPFGLHLMFVALYGAAHWTFAADLPAMTSRIDIATYSVTLQELKAGRDDAIPELNQPNGSPITEAHQAFVSAKFAAFFKALRADFISRDSRDPRVFNFNLSETAVNFIATLKEIYTVEIAVHEEFVIAMGIDGLAVAMVDTAGELMRVNV